MVDEVAQLAAEVRRKREVISRRLKDRRSTSVKNLTSTIVRRTSKTTLSRDKFSIASDSSQSLLRNQLVYTLVEKVHFFPTDVPLILTKLGRIVSSAQTQEPFKQGFKRSSNQEKTELVCSLLNGLNEDPTLKLDLSFIGTPLPRMIVLKVNKKALKNRFAIAFKEDPKQMSTFSGTLIQSHSRGSLNEHNVGGVANKRRSVGISTKIDVERHVKRLKPEEESMNVQKSESMQTEEFSWLSELDPFHSSEHRPRKSRRDNEVKRCERLTHSGSVCGDRKTCNARRMNECAERLQLQNQTLSSLEGRELQGSLKKKRRVELQDSCKRKTKIGVDLKAIAELVEQKSFKEVNLSNQGKEITEILHKPSHKQIQVAQQFRTEGGTRMREFCAYGTKACCCKERRSSSSCVKRHFKRIIQHHTIPSLGDCSYLDGCRHMGTCRFVHYKIDNSFETSEKKMFEVTDPSEKFTYLYGPQWINCDVRNFDFKILSKYSIIMADPPWDIHMELPYGTLKDQEMLDLDIAQLSTDGLMFLWVTGRTMELGRKCLVKWGYECNEEMIWIKTNQLQRLIRTGRTGHWLNHSKEHCLIGVKGNPEINSRIDCDVIVSEVRETSRKPDEVYEILERLAPLSDKLEIFGRPHNCRPGWMVLGNQLPKTTILDPKIAAKYRTACPHIEFNIELDDALFDVVTRESAI